ncbi:c-type cytochrome [Roseovarius autotrophicus]|uniref:c-type cytochrome n=1 Tax=Roseovarius autotrophicus TaxID=2824121 RepID=UPI0019F76711|nr:c-type cytochrome [Roseovarius autotrophicus]MBE0452885.1 c-type cytochrome [Roseovarius sp.]
MFDTMTLTKATGAICGSLLVFLLGSWAAESIYSMGSGYGDDRVQGFVIDTGADDAADVAADEGPSFAELFAAADMSNGERVFRNCAACHALEQGVNKAGPYLYGVVGRDVGASQGFAYSGALTAVVDAWTPQELDAFLENPRGYAPGTTMGYAGLRKAQDRADLIAFLDQTDGTTYEMPAAATTPAEEAPAEPEATEEAPAEEAPAEEEAAAEAPAEEAAAAEAPAQEAATTEEAAAEAAPAGNFATLVAAADVAQGEKLYRRCAACHAVQDGQNKAGPHLYAIVGRDIASVDGFSYSDALKGLDGAWTVEQLDGWLENPRAFAPGNRMGFPGLKGEEDRANLIGYLATLGN